MTANGDFPLSGIRVLDITQVWAGPQLGSSLGDMGAEVIRVESRYSTDFGRLSATDKSEIRLLLEYQRHARSRDYYVTLNLPEPEAMDIFRETVRTTDVFICNLSPRVMKKLHITYDDLRPLRPDLVMATISAAGQEGRWSDLVAFGPSLNAVVGSDSLVGYPETGELMSSYWDPDPLMGSAASYAVLMALYEREATGRGQHLDLTFSDVLTHFLGEPIIEAQMTGAAPGPPGNRHPFMSPHGIYPAAGDDSWVTIAAGTEGEWRSLCEALGDPRLTGDPRFATMAGRHEHAGELDALIAEWTRQRSSYEAMHLLQEAGVAAVASFTNAEIYHDPHDTYRRISIRVDDPAFDRNMVTYGIPWRLSETPGAFRRLGQPVGTDNEAFFQRFFGLSAGEVRDLAERKVLY